MKMIIFNDRYCLTEAVLEGRKTQTRRFLSIPDKYKGVSVEGVALKKRNGGCYTILTGRENREMGGSERRTPYRIGEEVAIAQAYRYLQYDENLSLEQRREIQKIISEKGDGMRNKELVKPSLMPHVLKITNMRVERLNDISNEDCKAEGIMREGNNWGYKYHRANDVAFRSYASPYAAYADLTEWINGYGKWNANPWVIVYEFKLLK